MLRTTKSEATMGEEGGTRGRKTENRKGFRKEAESWQGELNKVTRNKSHVVSRDKKRDVC